MKDFLFLMLGMFLWALIIYGVYFLLKKVGFFSSLTAYFISSKIFQESIKGEDWKSLYKANTASLKDKVKSKLDKIVGQKIYDFYLQKYLLDLRLSNKELKNLVEIQQYFSLPSNTIKRIKDKYNKQAVDRLSKEKLMDKELSDKDKKAIYQLAYALELPAATVENINYNNALSILRDAKNDAMSDSRLVQAEEDMLLELTEKLGLSQEDFLGSIEEKKRLAYCKTIWEVENDILPVIESPVLLQKNEVCHVAIDSKRLETKNVTTGYTGGSRGVSIRIAKGVSYRVGAYRSRPIKEEVTYDYPGTLVVTSKRIIFAASEKCYSFPLNKLDNIEQYRDGLGFQKGTSYYLMTMEYPDLIGLIISKAIERL